MAATRSFAWIGHGIGGAIGATTLWLVVNYFWTVNGAGLLERHGWPVSKIYLAAAAGAALGAMGGLIGQRRQARYARELAAVSSSMHFVLRPEVSREEMREYEGLQPVEKWSSARNRMIGRVGGIDVEMLDLTYAEKGGDGDTCYRQTILFARAPEGEFPAFELRPRDITLKMLGKMLGVHGITFAPAGASPADTAAIEQFSRRYHLSKGLDAEIQKLHDPMACRPSEDNDDQQAIRRVFVLKVLRFFAEHPRWRIESDGKHLAMWRNDTIIRPADRPTFVTEALEVRAALAQPLAFASDLPAVSTQPSRDLVAIKARMLGTMAGTFIGFFAGFLVNVSHFAMTDTFQPPSFLWGSLGFFGSCLLGIAVGACVGNRVLYYAVLYILRRHERTERGTPPRPYRQPRTSTALLEYRGKDLTITCPPAGIWRGNSAFLLVGCVLWNAFVIPFSVFFVIAAFRGEVKQEGTDVPASPLFVLLFLTPFWAITIGSVLAVFHHAKRWARLSVRGGHLAIEVCGLFGTKCHHWSRSDVKDIRADVGTAGLGINSTRNLCIMPASGFPVGVLGYRGKAEVAWMAQVVRTALGLAGAAEQD
jgi:hypothetical protein